MKDDDLIEELMDRIVTRRLSTIFKSLAGECERDRKILLKNGRYEASNYLSNEQITLESAADVLEIFEQKKESK